MQSDERLDEERKTKDKEKDSLSERFNRLQTWKKILLGIPLVLLFVVGCPGSLAGIAALDPDAIYIRRYGPVVGGLIAGATSGAVVIPNLLAKFSSIGPLIGLVISGVMVIVSILSSPLNFITGYFAGATLLFLGITISLIRSGKLHW